MSANASLSVDVEDVVVEREVTGKEATDDVMPERARRVHRLESLLLNSVVDLDVDVVEPLLLHDLAFRSACLCIRQKDIPLSRMVGLNSSAFGRVIETAGGE